MIKRVGEGWWRDRAGMSPVRADARPGGAAARRAVRVREVVLQEQDGTKGDGAMERTGPGGPT